MVDYPNGHGNCLPGKGFPSDCGSVFVGCNCRPVEKIACGDIFVICPERCPRLATGGFLSVANVGQ